MTHDALLKAAEGAIAQFVSDTSVPQDQTRDELDDLIASMKDTLDTLGD